MWLRKIELLPAGPKTPRRARWPLHVAQSPVGGHHTSCFHRDSQTERLGPRVLKKHRGGQKTGGRHTEEASSGSFQQARAGGIQGGWPCPDTGAWSRVPGRGVAGGGWACWKTYTRGHPAPAGTGRTGQMLITSGRTDRWSGRASHGLWPARWQRGKAGFRFLAQHRWAGPRGWVWGSGTTRNNQHDCQPPSLPARCPLPGPGTGRASWRG